MNVTAPLVTMIIPTFNRAGYVETAIQSVLDQSYPALEVIAIDDGSEDGTPEILARIAERADPGRFRWFRHDNVGQSETINRGLERATGDLLGYLSSDDYLFPGAIERMVAVVEERPNADVVYSDFAVVDESDRVQHELSLMQHTFIDSLRWGMCLLGVGALMRRRCYERIGGWNGRYRYVPDYEWWLRAGDAEFVHVPEVLGAWRSHSGSTTSSDIDPAGVRARLEERFQLLGEVFGRDDLPESVREVEREAYSATLMELANMLDHGLGEPGRRFALEDRLLPHYSPAARPEIEEGRLWYERKLRAVEDMRGAAEYRNAQLERAIAALEDVAAKREGRIATLEAELETARANSRPRRRRPSWFDAARRLVPPALRPPVGRAAHRVWARMR